MSDFELRQKFEENRERINELADLIEREKRERTDEETALFEQLKNENQNLREKMKEVENVTPEVRKTFATELRETLAAGKRYERAINDSSALADPAYLGIKVQDVVKPLYEGLILDKVGLPLQTGLTGTYTWPIYEAAEASIVGEGVALSDTAITFDQLQAIPERMGIAVPVSREAINRSNGVVESVVRDMIPNALTALINKVMFSTEAVTGATNLVGPFVGLTPTPFEGEIPTGAELAQMKAAVLASGVNGDRIAWVMTKAMEAILETTPINSAGVFRPIIEPGSHTLFGYPVFTTQYIGEGNIGCGDWAYQPVGLFGDINLVADPYTLARNNAVDFVCNVNFATKCLNEAAFALGTITPGT